MSKENGPITGLNLENRAQRHTQSSESSIIAYLSLKLLDAQLEIVRLTNLSTIPSETKRQTPHQ